MKTRKRKIPPSQWRFFFVFLLILGIFFRFFNIDRKFYWYDEVFTSIRIAGYTETEIVEKVALEDV